MTTDANFANVALLLHCDGTDGSTTFVDSSPLGQTVTVYGDACVVTNQKKFGTAAGSFDGDGDALTVPYNAGLHLASQDFTIEAWVRSYADCSGAPILAFGKTDGTLAWSLDTNGSGALEFQAYNGSGSYVLLEQSSGAGVAAGNRTWYHVAVTRSGNTWRLFLDGTQCASTTSSMSIRPAASAPDYSLVVGNFYGASYGWLGWLDDVRITAGVARYTAGFSVPTEAFPNSAPPTEGSINADSPLGSPSLQGSHMADPTEGSIQANGPLGDAALRAQHLFGSAAAAGPLGASALRGTFPVAAVGSASGVLGATRALGWMDFTSQIVPSPQLYVMDLVTPTGLVRVPISSWQATLQTDAACFVQCVVPAVTQWVDTINAATEFVVSRVAVLRNGQRIDYEMARAPTQTIQYAQGPGRHTATISGYTAALTANDDPPEVYDRVLQDVRSFYSGNSGGMRVRCAIDWLLRPGHRAFHGAVPILVDYVNYYAPGNDQYMDVGERA